MSVKKRRVMEHQMVKLNNTEAAKGLAGEVRSKRGQGRY